MMASTNQGPEYFEAEKKYLTSERIEDRIYWLEEMMRNFKKHKSSEKMLAELRTRLIKLKEKAEKQKKSGKTTKKGIKKEGPQAVFIGLTNSGKSSILNTLTNATPVIADYMFSTGEPLVAMMDYQNVKIQLIDQPAINHESFDKGITNTADLLLIVINKYEELEKIYPHLERTSGKRLVIYNKIDLLNEEEIRKLEAKLKSKKINYLLFSTIEKDVKKILKLKEKIFSLMGIIRVYLKEPGKEKSNIPMIFENKTQVSVNEVAEKIYKGMTSNIKEIRIWGPSSKFPGQKVGLKHELKDLDVVEFKTR